MRSRDAVLNENRREEILAAAARCFVRDGFDTTSMKSICLEAQMSPGTLYHYFRSRSDIVAGIIEREVLTIGSLIESIDDRGDIVAGLLSALERIATDLTDDELVLHAEIAAAVLRDRALRERARLADAATNAHLAEQLARARAFGLIDGRLDPVATAILIGAQIDGLIWRATLHGRPALLAALPTLKQAVARILAGADPAG